MLKNDRQTVKFLPLCVMVLLLAVLVSSAAAKTPKYVFLFIGDGMGIPQRSAANEFAGKKLLEDTFPHQGITTTHAADRFITGSAAAGTAMASGLKTNIGVVGMDPALKPVKTLGEMARDTGMKVGIVSSVSIDHATPACFYAHQPSRNMYHEIGMNLARSDFDYFVGGSLNDPTGKKFTKPLGNVLRAAKKNDYRLWL
ncbi:MAG: alkaline phosphatase [Desulfarculaceae bacterium]|nr:alkaline phosphatase [Desulfarculaceae bacterium]